MLISATTELATILGDVFVRANLVSSSASSLFRDCFNVNRGWKSSLREV